MLITIHRLEESPIKISVENLYYIISQHTTDLYAENISKKIIDKKENKNFTTLVALNEKNSSIIGTTTGRKYTNTNGTCN